MSTCNFDSRVKFGIYAFEPSNYIMSGIICDNCGTYNTFFEDEDICDMCGEKLNKDKIEHDVDYVFVDEDIQLITKDFEDNNFKFHKIRFESGYYESAQIVIEELYDIEYMDNEDTRYEFDLCLSETKRQFGVEERKIKRWLKWVCENYNIGHYGVAYQFSNGETGYSKIA